MMVVDTNKCIGCGLCIKDCFPKDIEIVDGKAHINNQACIKCGHCIAVCPKNAISIDEYDMADVKEYNKDEFTIEADNLLNFIKYRRSVRQYKDKPVEKEKLAKIIEAGRFTQTGVNMQDVSYVVVTEEINELKVMVLQTLNKMGEYILSQPASENAGAARYAQLWTKMYEAYIENPKENDKLFFNAPAVIVVTANSEVNGALAASNMELMTNALGLGTFFSGFFAAASSQSEEIKKFLGLSEGKKIVACMVVGYPAVNYLRTVPRKEAQVSWK